MKRTELKRKSWMKAGTKRIAKVGRRGKRRKAAGQIEGPLRDYVIGLGMVCDSCGREDDTIRVDHVKKRGMGGAVGDWLPNGDGNLWRLCVLCDEAKETHSQEWLDRENIEARVSGAWIARRHGEEYRRITEAAGILPIIDGLQAP